MRNLLLGPALLAVLVLAGCDDGDGGDGGGATGGDGGRGSEAALAGRTFLSQQVTVGGAPHDLVEGTQIRLQFDAAELGASAGCNHLSGAVDIRDERLVVGPMGGTEMGCPPELHAQDEWLMSFLTTGPAYRLDGDRLTLESGDTVIELLDREVADPDRPIEGTVWEFNGIIDGDAVSSPPSPATVLFSDGRVEVTIPNCNSGSGPAEVRDDGTIEIGEIVRTLIGCPEAEARTEGAIFGVLQGEITYEIHAGSLTLRHPSGAGLMLRAAGAG